nr:hypothetical protein [Tanacetum cinerariifolium]
MPVVIIPNDIYNSVDACKTAQAMWQQESVGNSGYSGNAQRVSGNNAMVQRISRTNVNGEDELEELNASCIMMARIQTVNNDYDAEPSYDSDFANEENSENVKQDTSAHDHKYAESESLMRNVQLEAEKTKEEIKTVKDANALLTTKLEKYKERVWVFENKPENKYDRHTMRLLIEKLN